MKNRGGLFSRLSTFLPALGLLLALGEALFSGSVAGQDMAKGMNTDAAETATDEFILEEIQVTAQFHEQYVQDTPIAITAVTTEMMEQRSQTDLSSIAAQAPNVVLIETGGAFGPGMSAYIRGVGQSDFNPAFEPGVGIYIDDVYYPSLTGANFDLLDLERVEISRGPQGVLGGRNSEGGSIKLYSEKPKGDGGGSFRATFGTRNLQDIRASGDFSLVTDTLFMRLSSASRKQDGYVKRYDYACLFPDSGIPGNGQQGDCFLGTQGGKDYTASRAALRWLASDAVEVNLSADYSLDNSEVAAITLQDAVSTPGNGSNGIEYDSKFVPSDPYISYAGYTSVQPDGRTLSYPPTTRTEVWGTNLNLDWTLTDGLALKSITSYREFDSRWVEDNDVSPLGGSLGSEHVFNDSFSEELRLNGIVFKDAVDYTLGAYYFDQTTTYQTHQVLNYTFPGFEFLGNDLVDASSYAGFFNASWHVTGAMNVNAGVRYTHDEKDYAYSRLPVGDSVTFGLENLNGTVGAYDGSNMDYRINVDYRFTDRILAYAGVATAFKGGGSNARPFFPSQAVPFDKEELTAYELGAKTDSLGKRLRINASVFFNDYKDIQMIMLACDEISPFPGAPCAATGTACSMGG
jgi:iron complex outermembrane receptor protein